MPGPIAGTTVVGVRPSATIPSDASLQELLERRRVAQRDRRLAYVIGGLRTPANRGAPASSGLLQAITDASRARSNVRRRPR
jgi:hypothetical protein